MQPLDGARLKIRRAQRHLECLETALAEFSQSDAHSVTVEKDGPIVQAQFNVGTPDPIISAIAGDCLTNCRAALDYIIWELAEKFAGRELEGPPFGHDRLQFPICETPNCFSDWKKALGRYNVPASALQIVESLQPYQGGNDELRGLNLLVNIDKHRLPLLIFGQVGNIEFVVNMNQTDYHATLPAKPANPVSSRVNVHSQDAVFVAWAYEFMPRGPMVSPLVDIVRSVSTITLRFEEFFH